MSQSSVGLVVRQQAWFRSFVESEALPAFPLAMVNSVALQPINVIRARVLIGRGALNHELQPEFNLWFGHGEKPYPILECPSIGPRGAGLFRRTTKSSITASDQEVVCLIEVSVVQPVDPELPAKYLAEPHPKLDQDGRRVLGPVYLLIEQVLTATKKRLEQAIGLYALYQYPVVWEPLGVSPLVAFVNLETQTLQQVTPVTPDNFIPFRLNVKDKVRDGVLVDDGLVEWHRLESNDLHIPLVLFQRALWQKNLQVRFLEMFWVIEHLAGHFAGPDDERHERENLYSALREFVQKECPQHKVRLDRLRGLIVQPALSQRLTGYFSHHGIAHDDDIIPRMLRLRNNLSHAGLIDPDELAAVELSTRVLVREVLRKELELRGIRFGQQPV